MPNLTETIIGCAMRVHTALGPGFLEKVYENALIIELQEAGLFVEQQKSLPVYYRDKVVGEYFADLLVERKVILELKAVKGLTEEFTSICLHYLKAAKMPVCLLINFGKPRLEWKRLVGETYLNETETI